MPPSFSLKKFEDLTESKHPEPEYNGTMFRIVGRDLGAEYMAMSMAVLKPGQKIPLHSHPTAEEIHVLFKGRSQVIFGKEKFDVQAISTLRFPPGSEEFGLVNNSEEDATWLFVGAPIDEYLGVYKKRFGNKTVQTR